MILQGESYEFGTVFQTDFVALLDVACWMLLVGSLLVGYRLLDIACWMLLFGNIGNQPNNKITKQQDNKKNAYRNLHI